MLWWDPNMVQMNQCGVKMLKVFQFCRTKSTKVSSPWTMSFLLLNFTICTYVFLFLWSCTEYLVLLQNNFLTGINISITGNHCRYFQQFSLLDKAPNYSWFGALQCKKRFIIKNPLVSKIILNLFYPQRYGYEKMFLQFSNFCFFYCTCSPKISIEKLDYKGLCNSIFKGIKKSDSTKKNIL